MPPLAIVYGLAAIALWSTNAVVANYVLDQLRVEQVQFLQFLGATVVFFAMRTCSGQAPEMKSHTRAAWFLGIVGLPGTMILQYLAFSYGPITEVNIIAYIWPLLAALFFVVGGQSKQPYMLLFMALVGLLGAALVITDGKVASFDFTGSHLGYAAAVGSAICMAVFTYGITRLKVDAGNLLLPGAIFGLLITASWCLATQVSWSVNSSLLLGIYLGAGPMGIGYILWSKAMYQNANGNIALLAYLTPVTSTALLISTGEALNLMSMVGALLIVGSCTIAGMMSTGQPHEQRQ